MGSIPLCCPRCGESRIISEENSSGKDCYKCSSCRLKFGNMEEVEKLVSRLMKFTFEVKDLFGNYISMMIHNDGKDCGYTVKVGDDRPREGKMDRDFWVSFSENLFGQWSFHKWSETYFGTASGDGILWDMEASFERKHTLSVHGCNSRPIFWNSIMKTLLPVIEKSGYEETFVHRLVRD